MKENADEIPASEFIIEVADDGIFFLGEAPVLDVRAEVIEPPQAAALAAAVEA